MPLIGSHMKIECGSAQYVQIPQQVQMKQQFPCLHIEAKVLKEYIWGILHYPKTEEEKKNYRSDWNISHLVNYHSYS